VGIVQKELDGTKLLAPEGLYEGGAFFHDDEFLPETRESAFSYNTSVGFHLKWKSLSAGFSSINLTESSIDYKFNDSPIDYRFSRHYLGFLSYRVKMNEDLGIEPSVFAKTDGIQTQMDFNVTLDYLSRFYLGLGYRGFGKTTTDAAILIGGLTISKNTTLMYSYDYTLSGLNAVSGGSHEVMLRYRLNKKIGQGKLPKSIHNPRFP
ncbi:MAG: PorP/SprF family type IX secretion system membrane protein, partial [Saprospiraceae bacterium]